MAFLTSCPRCGRDVLMGEQQLAEGDSALCDRCEGNLPGMYELLQAEKRSMDADPDWQERFQGPGEVWCDMRIQDTIVIAEDLQERWRFTPDQIDTVLLEMELLLIALRDGAKVSHKALDHAFDEIKAMRAHRPNAA